MQQIFVEYLLCARPWGYKETPCSACILSKGGGVTTDD